MAEPSLYGASDVAPGNGPDGPDPLPSNGRPFWLIALAVLTLLGLLESTKAFVWTRMRGVPAGFGHALVGNMPWWWAWALLTPPVVALARRFRYDAGRPVLTTLIHILAAGAFVLLHLSAVGVLYWYTHSRQVGVIADPATQIRAFLNAYSIVDLVTYAALVGGVWALDFYRRFRREELAAARLQLRAARLESTMNRARLDALRMELNPHFLFNTLNAISGLVRRRENEAAVMMLARLGDLLRVTLERDSAQEVPLETELAFLAGYLEIERIRFHDRLAVEMDVSDEALNALVPTLILQPLVENAVRHGIARVSGPGRVSVSAQRSNGQLVLQVCDTGAGFAPDDGPARRGVGLSNTESRLRQLYGGAARLVLGANPAGGAAVSVTLPFRTWSQEVGANGDDAA